MRLVLTYSISLLRQRAMQVTLIHQVKEFTTTDYGSSRRLTAIQVILDLIALEVHISMGNCTDSNR
jgi:hypothetical protein